MKATVPEIHSYYVPTGLPDLHGADGIVAAVEVRRILQRSGEWKWKIKDADLAEGPVLNRRLDWEYEALSSSRSEADLERTRFDSLDEALAIVNRYAETKLAECARRLDKVLPRGNYCSVCGVHDRCVRTFVRPDEIRNQREGRAK